MALTLRDLAEFKRQERDTPGLTPPPANFLENLQVYMKDAQAAAGPRPIEWDIDCEALAAMDLLKDIFEIRRHKLAVSAQHNAPPRPRECFDFEINTWTGLRTVYVKLDECIENVVLTGVKE